MSWLSCDMSRFRDRRLLIKFYALNEYVLCRVVIFSFSAVTTVCVLFRFRGCC